MQRTLAIIVDVDPVFCVGMSPSLVRKLAAGVKCRPCYRGVRVIAVDGDADEAPIYRTFADALLGLHTTADDYATRARDSGGSETATGRYWSDRAAFLRIVGQVLGKHRVMLWPLDSDIVASLHVNRTVFAIDSGKQPRQEYLP